MNSVEWSLINPCKCTKFSFVSLLKLQLFCVPCAISVFYLFFCPVLSAVRVCLHVEPWDSQTLGCNCNMEGQN